MKEESIWIGDFAGKCIREKPDRDEPDLVPEYTEHDLMLNQDNLVEYEAYIKSLRTFHYDVKEEQDGKELREGLDFKFEEMTSENGLGNEEIAIPIEPETVKPDINKSLGHIRAEVFDYINSHPYYPNFVKDETRHVIAMHFNCIGKILGLVELTFRRTYEHKEQIDPQLQKNLNK